MMMMMMWSIARERREVCPALDRGTPPIVVLDVQYCLFLRSRAQESSLHRRKPGSSIYIKRRKRQAS